MSDAAVEAPAVPAGDGAGNGGGAAGPADGASRAVAQSASQPKSPGAWIEDIADADLRRRVGKFAGKPVSDLAAAYAHAESLIGSDPTQLVKVDEAAKADPSGLLRRLGLPDTPDAYKFEGLPDGALSEDDLKIYAKMAHEAGLLPAQADKLIKATAALAQERVKQAEAALEARANAQIDELKKTYGREFDDIVKSAKQAAKELDLVDVLSDAGLGTHPKVISALAKIGKLFAEAGGPAAAAARAVGPHEAAEMARNLKRQQLAAVMAGDNAKADSLQAEIDALYRRAYGG